MRLLLLLSVLLSALSGVGASARVPGAVQTVAGRSAVQAALAPAREDVRNRPATRLPGLREVADVAAVPSALRASEPLWASRRRE